MQATELNAVVEAIRNNNNCVWNEHNDRMKEIHAVGLADGNVVALYDRDYFTISAIRLNENGLPCLKRGSVIGGVIILDNETTLETAIEQYNDLSKYDEWYRKHHKQITDITYVV